MILSQAGAECKCCRNIFYDFWRNGPGASVVLVRQLGWTPSRIVREALRRMAACQAPGSRRIIGLGEFSSGLPDLGSNKEHLRGFGE